jgi:hypothetical protein
LVLYATKACVVEDNEAVFADPLHVLFPTTSFFDNIVETMSSVAVVNMQTHIVPLFLHDSSKVCGDQVGTDE